MVVPEFIQFDKGKPFYDIVATFMVAMSGCPAIFNNGNPMRYTKEQYVSISGVHVPGKHLHPLDVYEQAQAGHTTQVFFVGHTSMMVANLAYESVKRLTNRSPEFEFLRHVRNAASHWNRFTFYENEPCRPASWRGVVLDHMMKGSSNPMHGRECFGATLGPADLIQLLADVESQLAP